jgi:hypothetical protein
MPSTMAYRSGALLWMILPHMRGYNYLSAFTPAHEPLNVIEVERGED